MLKYDVIDKSAKAVDSALVITMKEISDVRKHIVR